MEVQELVRTINEAIRSALANMHTMTVGRVVSVGATTIDVQPVISRKVEGDKVDLPVFSDVPVIFLQGGSSNDTFPIETGDYCLLFMAERCIDRWYAGNDEMMPLEDRMHDYSDAFAIVGVNPLFSSLTIPSKVTRKGDQIIEGDVEQTGDFDITGDVNLTGNYTQIGNMDVTGTDHKVVGNLALTGNLTVTGNITCTGVVSMASMVIGGIPVPPSFFGTDFDNHTHSSGSLLDSQSGAVTGATGGVV